MSWGWGELGLDFHLEAAFGLEQAQQQLREGNVFQRTVEDRFAYCAHAGRKLVYAGTFWDPAGFHMQTGDLVVIAVEKGEKDLGKVALILGSQGAADAEIHGNIGGEVRVADIHKQVAGVHVGMKKIVLEHLGEKYFHAVFRKLLHVDAGRPQRFEIVDRNTSDPFQDKHAGAGVIPVHVGDVEQWRVLEVAPQLRGVRTFLHQVEFGVDGAVVLGHHLNGM